MGGWREEGRGRWIYKKKKRGYIIQYIFRTPTLCPYYLFTLSLIQIHPRLFIFDGNNFLLFHLHHLKQHSTRKWMNNKKKEKNQPNKRNESNFFYFLCFHFHHTKEIKKRIKKKQKRKKCKLLRWSEIIKKKEMRRRSTEVVHDIEWKNLEY